MNRLTSKLGRLSQASNLTSTLQRHQLPKLGVTQINSQHPLSTTASLYYSSPAGQTERPELASDKDRTAQSPKSSDEKILDRAQQGEKDKAPFTEEEEQRKGLDRKEGYGEHVQEEWHKKKKEGQDA